MIATDAINISDLLLLGSYFAICLFTFSVWSDLIYVALVSTDAMCFTSGNLNTMQNVLFVL
jgi:hypothetical protein